MFLLKKLFTSITIITSLSCLAQARDAVIEVNTNKGYPITKRASGFNVRIADKVWSYTHPDFRKAVKELNPGWLRYFSGTMGDAFSAATGHYDLDYIAKFDHPKPFLKGYQFLETKGPHRITDLYNLLREVNGKLVVTVNAFAESPKMTLELARFCKNNNIKVETWQFCNEPYFYVPNRNRYWWNDGYDYAAKMQPHAEAIQQVFPDAKLALNYTWDGVWTFMKEIRQFQEKHGAYWNVFSKHSYAPHTGKKETLEEAYKRANTKLLEATSSNAMQEIEDYTWKDVPMVITEFGVWNRPLNGVYESIYNIEYVMRQLEHDNTQLVGVHEVSSKYTPLNNKNNIIENAFNKGLNINTDTINTGVKRKLEGKAYKIYHEATNNADYLIKTSIVNNVKVPGLKNTEENGMFAQTYRGLDGFNYLVVTNRSGESTNFKVKVDGALLKEKLITNYFTGASLATKNTDLQKKVFKNGEIIIKPYSVTVAKWKTNYVELEQPRIYNATVENKGVLLKWGNIPNATSYQVYYGTNPLELKKLPSTTKKNNLLVEDLEQYKTYYFKVEALNNDQKSDVSEQISVAYTLPKSPNIFKVARRENAVTLFWQSVPNAKSYIIKYINENNEEVEVNTNNVFGYKVKDLKNNHIYNFTVNAYNGLGNGKPSEVETVKVSTEVPYSPRNISAYKKSKTSIQINWIAQENVKENTTYNLYRGTTLNDFIKIASGIKNTTFLDNAVNEETQYYYTVKAETEAGESNFYPNIATTFPLNNNGELLIKQIEKEKNGYLVKVFLSKTLLEKHDTYGVIINNISYLNVENVKILGEKNSKKSFDVYIPFSDLKENSKYAIKAFVKNKHKSLESNIIQQRVQKNN